MEQQHRKRAPKGSTTRRFGGVHTAQSDLDALTLMERTGLSESDLYRQLLRCAAEGRAFRPGPTQP